MKFLKVVLIAILLILMSSLSFGATLNLKATWTPNTEADMASYNLYETDAGRVKINQTPIRFYPGPGTSSYLFSVTVPDPPATGTLSFVLTAVNTSGAESADSNTATYIYNAPPPNSPKNLKIIKP
jgi:hypothetical protein